MILELSTDSDKIIQNIVAWMYFSLAVNNLILPKNFTKLGLTKAVLELYVKQNPKHNEVQELPEFEKHKELIDEVY